MTDLMPMPFSNPSSYKGHGGIDFAQDEWTPIPAITAGVITYAGWWTDRAGYTKTITRSDGLQIMHCHLPDLSGLGVGARVSVGQKFAFVGDTGRSTGPHLHLEMWLRGVPQNEWDWMDPNNWIGKGGSAGGGGQPIPSPTKEVPFMNGILYYRTSNDRRDGPILGFALAGSGENKAGWLDISDQALANDLAANTKSGRAVFLAQSTWDKWRAAYLGK